jgi:hypothetical protein
MKWQRPITPRLTREERQERDQALAYPLRTYNLNRGDLEACANLKKLAAPFPGGLPRLAYRRMRIDGATMALHKTIAVFADNKVCHAILNCVTLNS